jgi:hypothetical protein
MPASGHVRLVYIAGPGPWLIPVTESAACSRPTQGKHMPSAQPDPLFSVAEIGVIPCAKCRKPMRVSSIEPTGPGFDVRTFECEKCNHTVKFAVSILRGASHA